MQYLSSESSTLMRSTFTPQIETYFFPPIQKEEESLNYGDKSEDEINLLHDDGVAEPLRKRGKLSKLEIVTSNKFSSEGTSIANADSLIKVEEKSFEASVPINTSSTVNTTTTEGEVAITSFQSLSMSASVAPKRKRGRPPKNNRDKTTPNSSEPGTPQSSGSSSPPLYSPQYGNSGTSTPTTLISPLELQNLLGFPGSPTPSESVEGNFTPVGNISPSSSPSVKRGRGRPRKNPPPLPSPIEISQVGFIFEPIAEKQDKRLSLPSDFQITDFVRGAFSKDFEPERSIDEIMLDLRNTFGMDSYDRRNFVWEVYEAFSIPDMLKV